MQCLRNKLPEIETVLEDYNLDILCVNEHWLTKQELQIYVPHGYIIGNKFCRNDSPNGGSCIFYKKMALILNQLMYCRSVLKNVVKYVRLFYRILTYLLYHYTDHPVANVIIF